MLVVRFRLAIGFCGLKFNFYLSWFYATGRLMKIFSRTFHRQRRISWFSCNSTWHQSNVKREMTIVSCLDCKWAQFCVIPRANIFSVIKCVKHNDVEGAKSGVASHVRRRRVRENLRRLWGKREKGKWKAGKSFGVLSQFHRF